MAKQLLISERPGESAVKQSIGNYKGVMLCNRPNDPSDKPVRDGPAPFISRVTVKEQLGINPSLKPVQTVQKPKKTLEILKRHRQWLVQLQKQKEDDAIKDQENLKAQEEKMQKMKKKYKPKEKTPETAEKKLEKLTEKNLRKLDTESKESKPKERPKWAMTEEEAEFHEEKEVDNLLEYVQSLDYDSFIDDLEIRQALEIVKERVEEIKKDKEWKHNIAAKYNVPEDKDNEVNGEVQSRGSKASMNSFVSKARSQIDKNLEGNKKNEAEWDRSVNFI